MVKYKKDSDSILMSEINIIPFTDILLVILVAFIVTTPLLVQSTIKVKLPKVEVRSEPAKEKSVNITISREKRIYINDKPSGTLQELEEKLEALDIRNKIVIVNADTDIDYGTVAKVLGTAKTLGASKIELAIDSKKEASR